MDRRLLDWTTWRRLPRMQRVDAAAFATTTFAVLVANAVAAVGIGCTCPWYAACGAGLAPPLVERCRRGRTWKGKRYAERLGEA
jgi:hypothetical protein